jgi:hypothetical protein
MENNVTTSPSIANITKAVSAVQAVLTPALKDSSNPFFKSKYADLGSVWEAIRKPLSDNGLAIFQLPGGNGELLTLTTILSHVSGEFITGTLTMRPAKNDPQGIGSCISYARRYALSAIIGGYAADDDGNTASNKSYQTFSPAVDNKPKA